ncbi:hypothetical protein IWW55_003196 [Coemansia sp. RSA 2706]|nr:hypothetical protein IWW55_003196 [Coemansia sp. RSA 2706]KAJ2307531.1 hypothetical protein IWW54_004359 [Coemansia sp. RSA 2705]KAJ2315183.1 hypothetical protein IWW52_004097 [Coemansia sp. RSA 2704]
MADKGQGSGGSSPSKLDRFLSKLGRTMSTPRNGIRARRGGSPPQPAAGSHEHGSIRADTLRKRERVAELRRQREQQANGRAPRRSQVTSPGETPQRSSFAAMAAALRNPQPLKQALESDEFFDSPELNLLAQPLDPDAAVAHVDPVPPSQRRQPPAPRGPPKTPARDENDFIINIPPTTLSPLVPRSADRRQRSRTAVFAAESADAAPDAGRQRPQTYIASGGQHSSHVYMEIEAEMAQNQALKRELAQLDATVKALERLVDAGKSLRAVREAC